MPGCWTRDGLITCANLSFLKHFGLKWQDICGDACHDLGNLFLGADALELGILS